MEGFALENWHLWLIAAGILFIAELFTPGFVLACFGVGCLVSALFALFGLGLVAEIIVFCIASFISFLAVRPLFIRYFHRPDDTKARTNVDALVGKTGLVTMKIVPAVEQGRVNVGGEDWRGVSAEDCEIEKGERIEVTKVEGTKLFVKRISQNAGG